MIENNKKFEEIIYLSLIAKFDLVIAMSDSVNGNNSGVYFCFVESLPKTCARNQAIYITSDKVVSDELALTRLCAFERKIFDNDYNNKLSKSELNYSKRIKEYVKHVAVDEDKTKFTIKNFYVNTYLLYLKQVISKEQIFTAQEYIEKQFKEQNDLTK